MGTPVEPVTVRGGAGGITATTERIDSVAGVFGAVATDCLGSAFALHGYLADPAITMSAPFDPIGYANFEADLLDALDGLHGLSWVAALCGALDGELRLAASAYERADQLYTDAHDEVLGALRLPEALADGVATLARTHSPVQAAEAAIAHDPEAADTLVDDLGLPAVIAGLAHVLPDGHGVVHRLGTDSGGVAGRPPRRLDQVVRELGRRDGDSHHGAIDVRILTLPDGQRRVIVDITGTKSWSLTPTPDITSLTTNGRALTGVPTAYEQGVVAAMREAGVRPTDKVMLVGHSEGGMVAVEVARDAGTNGTFDVTHVVTAGSPVGMTVGALPRRIQVLALENEHDVVPHLDGVANPDEPNITTVESARGDGSVGGDHGIDSAYVDVSRDAEASGSRSIRHFLRSAGSFFRAEHVRTHTFQITRGY